MSLHLSFTLHGKAGILDNVPGRGQNRTREIRPSGIVGGPSFSERVERQFIYFLVIFEWREHM
ncbi:MAG: hypothetical protein O6948_04480 [Deltaproteobacteria bacterium]|nr:hypothetical protein [Deltaproteobacteria bacterium]